MVKIAQHNIGNQDPCYIIAEIGNNHDASLEKAKELIRASADTGVDAIKFQTFKSLDIVSPRIPANAYPNWDVSDKYEYWYQFVDSIAMPYEWYDELIELTRSLNMDFISTPASLEALNFLIEKEVDGLKVASMDLNNTPFLKKVSESKLPIIISTGMSTMEEIDEAYSILKNNELVLLHCVSNYPLNAKDANLRNILTFKEKYDVPIGFSNHAFGYDLDIAAVSLGACMIEKHITLDRNNDRMAEHHISMEPNEMKEMVNKVRLIEQALGSKERTMTELEFENRGLSRRSVVINKDKSKGDVLSQEDVSVIRPGGGIEPKFVSDVIGKKIKRDIKSYELITWEDIQ